jgi:hypothetical protein
MSDAIAAAARLVIAGASPETVRRVLRMLLDDVAPASASRSSPSDARPAAADPVWNALRQQVREAMTKRGAIYEGLAVAISCSSATARISVGRRQPATQRIQAALREWLEAAPEVAASALPFRGERTGNGAAAVASPHAGPVLPAPLRARQQLLACGRSIIGLGLEARGAVASPRPRGGHGARSIPGCSHWARACAARQHSSSAGCINGTGKPWC